MQDALRDVGTGLDKRALVYDAKQDVLPLLDKISPHAEIITLNPFDARGAYWDLCRDVREPRVAVELAFTLIPSEHESQPFFSNASRHLLYGVVLSYMLSGHHWTFADLIRGLARPKRLKAILKRHPETRDIIARYFHDERLLDNIFSTIAAKLLPLESVAAAWESAQRGVSLEEWSQGESILVMGNSEISRSAIDAINRAIFKRATDYILGQSESFTRRTWFILDELSECGKLDGLVSILKKGRSRGACVSINFQTISGLRDNHLYGPYLADEILGQIGNHFFGRLEDPETSDRASKLFGDQEIDQYTTNNTWGGQGGSTTTRSQQVVTRRTVLPSEFMSADPCNRENGLTGYYRTRTQGNLVGNLPGDGLFDHDLIPPSPDVPAFVPREVSAQLLKPWTKEQAQKFGVKFKAEPLVVEPQPELAPEPEPVPNPVPDAIVVVSPPLPVPPPAPVPAPPKRKPDLSQLDDMDNLFL